MCDVCPEPHRGTLKCKPYTLAVPQVIPDAQNSLATCHYATLSDSQQCPLQTHTQLTDLEDTHYNASSNEKPEESETEVMCWYCDGEHRTVDCDGLLQERPYAQWVFLAKHELCARCLELDEEAHKCNSANMCKSCIHVHNKPVKCPTLAIDDWTPPQAPHDRIDYFAKSCGVLHPGVSWHSCHE